MGRSAIVLAGGVSTRFSQDKGLLELANKPLIKRVVDVVSPLVDEMIVVTNSRERAERHAKVLTANVQFVVDVCDSKGPLIGALTGFGFAHEEYSLLLASDTPFVSREVVSLLFELCLNKGAAIPRWPNAQIEPLHAVYRTQAGLEAAKTAVDAGRRDMPAMVEKMRAVRYISTMVIQQLDPDLRTFFKVSTPIDLKKAVAMIKPRRHV
jgi:molybdopterin-guanine dinucleotide biosynthesis protein A